MQEQVFTGASLPVLELKYTELGFFQYDIYSTVTCASIRHLFYFPLVKSAKLVSVELELSPELHLDYNHVPEFKMHFNQH